MGPVVMEMIEKMADFESEFSEDLPRPAVSCQLSCQDVNKASVDEEKVNFGILLQKNSLTIHSKSYGIVW